MFPGVWKECIFSICLVHNSIYIYHIKPDICDIQIFSSYFFWLAIFWDFFPSFLVLVLPVSLCIFENICFIHFNALLFSPCLLTSWWNVPFINIKHLSSYLILWPCIQFCQAFFSQPVFIFIEVISHVFVHLFVFKFPRHKHTCCKATAVGPTLLMLCPLWSLWSTSLVHSDSRSMKSCKDAFTLLSWWDII